MNIFYVAAFAPKSNKYWFSLGRQRKINQVIEMLSNLGFHITRLNIVPTNALASFPGSVNLCKSAFVPLRFAQLAICSFLFFLSPKPRFSNSVLWLYNTRAAEFIVAFVGLLFHPRLQLVIQLEDLPSARLANHGVAGLVDRLTTYLLGSRANHIFAVSQSVVIAFSRLSCTSERKISILPPTLDRLFIEKAKNRIEPFVNHRIVILYAGSFQAEKGVSDLIQAFLQLDPSLFELRLIGSAPTDVISEYSSCEGIAFFGVVNLESLFEHYVSADIIVNPHRPILNSDHVFPFKLVETVASGALPLTTPVPGSDVFGLPDDCFFRDVHDLAIKLSQSRSLWERCYLQIIACAADCRARYSLESIQSELDGILRSV